ncbi:hypothetical protein ACFSJM_06700 [Lactococcus formosensis subsp. bovis]|uniref:hypothetical protein n=1 Tax=Lactococcus formosensis TaxID=1281486 RepID=UPI001BCDCA20|nr:hypothetical protein [Lactococcus formosensis]
MTQIVITILTIVVPFVFLVSGLVIAILFYFGTRNSVEGAKTRLGFYGIACFAIALGFGVGPRIFSSLTSPLSDYLTKALPGVPGVDAITTSVTALLGFLTFGAILLGGFQLAWGSRDSIEGGKKRYTSLLIGGITMLIVFAVAPKIATSLLDMAKNNMNKFFDFG